METIYDMTELDEQYFPVLSNQSDWNEVVDDEDEICRIGRVISESAQFI